MMKVRASMAIVLLLLLVVGHVAQTRKKLSEAEATRRFEEFVIENGYTDLPPTKDKSKLVPEPVWGGTDPMSIELRRNSLERKPLKIWKGNRFYRNGWKAFFLAKRPGEPGSGIGRLIYMDAYGKRMYVEHQPIYLRELERKPR